MITKAEAGNKWCPFALVAMAEHKGAQWNLTHYAPAFNRLAANGEANKLNISGSYCIASGCMAWRAVPNARLDRLVIVHGPNPEYTDESPPHRPDDVPENFIFDPFDGDYPARWSESNESRDARQAQIDANPRGYCGLAGSP